MARKDKVDRGVYEYPKDSGHWHIEYVDQYGKRKRESIARCSAPDHTSENHTCQAKKQALRTVRDRRKQVKLAKLFPQPEQRAAVTLGDAILSYLQELKTRSPYMKDWIRYGEFWGKSLGSLPIDTVKAADIERVRRTILLKTNRSGAPISATTCNHYLSFIKNVMQQSVRDELLDSNPCARVKALKVANERVRWMTPEEETKLKSLAHPGLWVRVEISYLTGMRLSEQAHLRWEFVDFTNQVITIPRSKSGKKRHVQICDRVIELLRGLPSFGNSPWAWPNQKGTNHTHKLSWSHAFKKLTRRAGIQDLHWHDLRHTFCSRLVMTGVDIRTVQELAGHHSIMMTQRYSHLSPKHLADAVLRLQNFSSETPTEPPQ